MAPKDHLRLTREELYRLVWAKPMAEVGRDFQISDRAMAKICARKQVPVPPRGYWAKKNAGKSVSKLPLTEFVVRPPKERKRRETSERQTPEKRNVRSVFDERNQAIKKAVKEFRKALSEAVDYTVRIEEWRCDYSFGLNSVAPYSEWILVLKGVFLEPANLRQRKFEALFSPKAHLNKKTIEENLHRYEESPQKSVGAFMKQNLSIVAVLSIPEDEIAIVLQNAAAHKINFVTIRGQKLRYGHGNIYDYSLQEQQEQDE
jgi:hypothetical protein